MVKNYFPSTNYIYHVPKNTVLIVKSSLWLNMQNMTLGSLCPPVMGGAILRQHCVQECYFPGACLSQKKEKKGSSGADKK